MRRATPNQFSGRHCQKLAGSKHPATEFTLLIAGANSRHPNSTDYSTLIHVPVFPLGFYSGLMERETAREVVAGASLASVQLPPSLMRFIPVGTEQPFHVAV